MRRIGLTQRVARVADRVADRLADRPADDGERRDALDQRWAELLVARGLVPVPLPNLAGDAARHAQALALDGVILTGGNDLAELGGPGGRADAAPERDRFERALVAFCAARGLPVLGVCRGAQLLSLFHGGGARRIEGHVARRHAVARAAIAGGLAPAVERAVRAWPARFEVNSYHAFTLAPDRADGALVPLALADDGSVEAVAHARLPQLGILWHPERERPFPEGALDVVAALFRAPG